MSRDALGDALDTIERHAKEIKSILSAHHDDAAYIARTVEASVGEIEAEVRKARKARA